LVLERCDKTPEQLLHCLLGLLEDRDTLRRQHAAVLFRCYAESYPEIDFSVFRARLTRALSDKDPTIRSFISSTLDQVAINALESEREVNTSDQTAAQSHVP